MNAAIPERRPATEEISGVIERVTFHYETTVIGSLSSVTAGEWLIADGWWVRDKEHGLQFRATTMNSSGVIGSPFGCL